MKVELSNSMAENYRRNRQFSITNDEFPSAVGFTWHLPKRMLRDSTNRAVGSACIIAPDFNQPAPDYGWQVGGGKDGSYVVIRTYAPLVGLTCNVVRGI